jgi:phosphohistidine phosphatase SixA
MSQALTLMLLRHAHAEPTPAAGSDADRALSALGVSEADAAGQWLRSQALPQRAVTSPARRAQETLARVVQAIGNLPTTSEASIYEATPGELMGVVEANRDAGRLLLVGHNPGFESLVALLTTGQSGDHRGMPPAGLAVLDFPAGAAIEPGAAELTAFWSP